ncbi:NAC domain-containing protein 35-like [Wolffia australiana]
MAGLQDNKDALEHNAVMPGFRFHPTEEELVDFYLRRKVEGKRFSFDIISFLELYRYDPWELPAMATIGEKDWFFYVPRDKKYRNGDRPNRVTTSGYWKATGADRIIRTENSRPIGLKKTLVFYSGKAPKGVRTNWIMNEYRLPREETRLTQKAEISLCRVYKRSGVEESGRVLANRPSSSRAAGPDKKQLSRPQPTTEFNNIDFSTHDVSDLRLTKEEMFALRSKEIGSLLPASLTNDAPQIEEMHRTASHDQSSGTLSNQHFLLLQQSHLHLAQPHVQMNAFPDKIWEWNHLP